MPAPNTPPAAQPIRQAVEAQFRTCPTLRSVTAQLLATNLKEKYPPLTYPLADLRLAVPREGGGRTLLPLLEVTLGYLADGSFPDVSTRLGLDSYLSGVTGNRLTYPINGRSRDYDLEVIEGVINELPTLLFIDFQQALATYWSQDSDAGVSRWKWLADVLQGSLLESATRQAGDAAQPLNILSTLSRYPDRVTRAARPWPENAVRAYTLETELERAGARLTLQASEILIVSRTQVLLCSLDGKIDSYSDLDAFGQAWGERMQQRFLADKITWRQYEPDGNIFEIQAALVLNQQLDDLATIELPARSTVTALEQLFATTVNPGRLFTAAATPLATLSSLQSALPVWLQRASAADRLAYRQCLIEQAGIRRLTLGDADFDGLETLRSYATQHLNHQLCLDRAEALGGVRTCSQETLSAGYAADDVELTFHVPVGSLEGGYIEPVSMTLVDLALKNLSGRPKGRMTLSHRRGRGREVEAWLTADYILQLIQRVDIGKNYPNYLRQALMSDTEAAQKRQRLFQQQRPVHLKIRALEHKIKGEAGLTSRGVQYVNAVLDPDPMARRIDGNAIVIRPLAFLRRPGATADVVQNMFIIEPLDTQLGPHVLYRPAYPDSLREFARREQLLAAIVQPGPLQDSVLAWLPDAARAIYSHGGFTQPHIVRVGMGSEFDSLPRVPTPAELAGAGDESGGELLQSLNHGNLMEYLFGSETRQLLDQAERESTSNRESRWALILEGMQLGFNTLLMAVRGPLAAVGWLLQLAQGLTQDLPALESDNPTARELAWVDLLLNISLLMIHHGTPAPVADTPPFDAQALTLEPFRHPLPGPATTRTAVVARGIVGLPAEPPGGGRTLMDFDHSLASDSASARLLDKLRSVNIAWPTPAPEPVKIGPHAGLYSIDGRWHASVGGLLFRVSIVPGFGEVFIIHPEHPDHPGIKLKTDGRGRWTLDPGLKLLGGGRKDELQAQNRRKKEQVLARVQALSQEIPQLLEPFDASLKPTQNALDALKHQRKIVQLTAELLKKATDAQRPGLEARHLQETLRHQTLRSEFEILLQNLEVLFAQSLPPRLEMVTLGQELEKVGGAGAHVRDREKILNTIWDQQLFIHTLLLGRLNAMRFSRAGEPMAEMARRMFIDNLLGDRTVYNEYISNAIESANIRQHMGEVSAAMENTLQRLEQDSRAGRVVRQKLLDEIAFPQHFFSDNLKLNALNYLAAASVEMTDTVPPPEEDLYIRRLEHIDLFEVLLSHVEVRSSAEYPLAEQRDVYETVLKQYNRYEEAIRALKVINPRRLRPESERLLKGLEYAKALAQNELEAVVRKQEALDVELPLSKNLRPKLPTKRVFKTRRKQYLIGELKPAGAQGAEERFTITDTLTGETVSAFSRHEDGWAATEDEPAAPMPTEPQSRSLATLKSLGQALIEQRKGIDHTIATDQQKLDSPLTRQQVNPGDWDELLTGHARKLTALAEEIQRDHLDKLSAQDLVDEYLAQARDMNRQAQRVCSEAYKRQWPTPESLNYLWEHQEIDINLTSLADPQRPTLSGDFFTEYAVYDKAKKPPAVLWYAHFHYATADAPPARYTRAHLKLPEQRKFTQKDLLKEHVQTYLRNLRDPGSEPVTNIVYVLITPPVDQIFLAIAPLPRANP